jgi:lipopolysaccharide/colanic/teichoic acid biosynthesis glycosyltransferase
MAPSGEASSGSHGMNAPFTAPSLVGAPADTEQLVVAPSLERRRLQCYLALMLGDIAALFVAFALPGYLFTGPQGLGDSLRQVEMVLPVFLIIALYNGSYSVAALRDSWVGIFRAQAALLISVAAVVFIAFFAKASSEFSRLGFSSGTICAILILLWTRLQMRGFTFRRCGANPYNQLVIDDGGPRVDLPGAIRVSASGMGLRPNLNDPHALDRLGMVLRNIDRVTVSCPASRRADWAMMLKGANVEGEVLDDEVARLGAQGARVSNGYGLLLVSAGPLGLRDRIIKRLLDASAAGAAILLLSPLLVAVAIAIKLQDRGPVFFVQRRMGRGNRFFNMYKFRSMTVALCDSEGNVSASKNDQRITKVGKFIRSTSIDELPQLFNVLLGDMSLVGPRPHAIGSQAGSKLFWEIDLRYWQRHSLKPGLSGLAQVRGFRGATEKEADLTDRLQSDLEYLEGWTIMRDVKIIFLTLRVLVHDKAF